MDMYLHNLSLDLFFKKIWLQRDKESIYALSKTSKYLSVYQTETKNMHYGLQMSTYKILTHVVKNYIFTTLFLYTLSMMSSLLLASLFDDEKKG